MLDLYDTNEKLLEKVQSGIGDPEMYNNDQSFLDIEKMFAGIEPEDFYQQLQFNPSKTWSSVGKNDIQKAKAVAYSYYIAKGRNEHIDENAYLGFEEHLHEAVAEWSINTRAATFHIFTNRGYNASWAMDVN